MLLFFILFFYSIFHFQSCSPTPFTIAPSSLTVVPPPRASLTCVRTSHLHAHPSHTHAPLTYIRTTHHRTFFTHNIIHVLPLHNHAQDQERKNEANRCLPTGCIVLHREWAAVSGTTVQQVGQKLAQAEAAWSPPQPKQRRRIEAVRRASRDQPAVSAAARDQSRRVFV